MMCHDTDCMDSNRCFICHNDILFWSAVWRRGLLNTKLILTKLLVWSAHQSVIHDQHTGKKFSKSYMLARELGRGAFSVVKLGVNKVLFVCVTHHHSHPIASLYEYEILFCCFWSVSTYNTILDHFTV